MYIPFNSILIFVTKKHFKIHFKWPFIWMIIEAIHNIVWEFAKVMNISVEIYDQDIENSFLKPCVFVNSNIHLFLLLIHVLSKFRPKIMFLTTDCSLYICSHNKKILLCWHQVLTNKLITRYKNLNKCMLINMQSLNIERH